MIPARTRTTTISRIVKPACRTLVADIPVFALAAVLAVGAERDEVVGLARARAGYGVAVVVAPRVLEIRLLGVGAVPLALGAARLLHQVAQALGVLADL